jgi:hypothetical protein
MGNSNSPENHLQNLELMVKPIKDIYDKLNKEVKDGLNNVLYKRQWPDTWYDDEKAYSYSARNKIENSKESFKITFYPNGTCSTLETRSDGKDEYIDYFGFGVFFATPKGVNVEIVMLGTTHGWELKHQVSEKLDSREYYFGRRTVVHELISYSELISDIGKGPYVLVSSS